LSETRDFWLSCGHHLLDRGEDGGLIVTDEFLKTYLARPEIAPPLDACAAECALHRALLKDPRQPVEPSRIAAIADADARENWELLILWRDHLVRHATLEAAYLQIVRHELKFPRIFLDQLVQVILRNILDDCDDVFVLRAAGRFVGSWMLAKLNWAAVTTIFSLAIFTCFLLSMVGGVRTAAYLLPFSGLCMSILYPTINSKGISCFRKAEHGTVSGVILFFTCGAAVVGPLAMGAISDRFGDPKYGFILATGFAGLLFLSLLLNWILNPTREILQKLDAVEYHAR